MRELTQRDKYIEKEKERKMKKEALKKIGLYDEIKATEEHLEMLKEHALKRNIEVDPKDFRFKVPKSEEGQIHRCYSPFLEFAQ